MAVNHMELCNVALESVRHLIPDNLHREVHDFVNRFNEWGVGMEMLIDEIAELEIKITNDQFDLIHATMRAMSVAESNRLAWLRDHNISVK